MIAVKTGLKPMFKPEPVAWSLL